MRKSAILIAPLLLLGGCISFGSKPPPRLISLSPQDSAPPGAIGGGDVANAILVVNPDTDRRLDVNRVPVQVDPSTVAYLKDATWVERPARQFRHLLAETIRTNDKRLVLEGNDAQIGTKTVLSGRLLNMGYDAPSQSVIVRFDALLEKPDGSVATQRFEAKVPNVAPKVDAVAPALNDAANKVAQEVAQWVGAA